VIHVLEEPIMSVPTREQHRRSGEVAVAAPERPRPASLAVDGVLVVAVELRQWLGGDDPPDRLFGFRRDDCWTLVTLWRRERWADDGVQRPVSGKACVSVQEVGSFAAMADTVRDRYGQCGWRDVLSAGRDADAELFAAWVPVGVARDLDRAVFFRPELAGVAARLDALTLADLRVEIAERLAGAGCRQVEVGSPPRMTRSGENRVVAREVVRRYGCEASVIVRMDAAGEVYPRLVEGDDGFGPAVRPLGEDDEDA
jgi:hypothetical protein